MNLYVTADHVGTMTGGGRVTKEESEALKEMGPCKVWDRKLFDACDKAAGPVENPPSHDDHYASMKKDFVVDPPELAHFYAGTFSNLISVLRSNGTKVCYTVAAHDIEASKRAHEEIGLQFNYPHLTDPVLWKRYCRGYMEADVVVCPSSVAAETVRKQGRIGPIEIIPHGCDMRDERDIKPCPKQFTVGYLGAIGADKGLRWLLEAWKKLNYKDAVLRIAGRDSTSPFMRSLVERYGGGSIHLAGWQEELIDFYNGISVYCQPSCTEGFGIECIEAMSFARPVVCSVGAGAVDAIRNGTGMACKAFDSDTIAECIDEYKKHPDMIEAHGKAAREVAWRYSWQDVREKYKKLRKTMLSEPKPTR